MPCVVVLEDRGNRVSKRGRNAGGRSVWQIDLRPCSQCIDGIERRQEFWQEHPQRLKEMPAWRRGQIPRHRVLYCRYPGNRPYELPSSALELSMNLLQAALDQDERAEILAAALAGSPCELEAPCFRCGCMANTWRPILKPTMNIPRISSWRLTRPENHVPICQHCAGNLSWETDQIWRLRWDMHIGGVGLRPCINGMKTQKRGRFLLSGISTIIPCGPRSTEASPGHWGAERSSIALLAREMSIGTRDTSRGSVTL